MVELLEQEYLARLPRWKQQGPAAFTHDSSSLVLGDQEVWMELDILPAPAGTGGVCVVLHFDSKAYESAYDVFAQQPQRDGLEALIELCTRTAAAAGAEGFRLRFDQGPARPLTVNALVQGLTSVDASVGLVTGVAAASPHWPKVKQRWPDWAEQDGYQVLELLGASEAEGP